MKLIVSLVVLGVLSVVAAPPSRANAVVAGAYIDAADKGWALIERITVSIDSALESQRTIIKTQIEPFDFTDRVPMAECDEVNAFRSIDAEPIKFSFGGDKYRTATYQLVWTGMECPAPARYLKSGYPTEWHYLTSMKLVPIYVKSSIGADFSITVTSGEEDIYPQPSPRVKEDKLKNGEKYVPKSIAIEATMKLDVRRHSRGSDETVTALITVDGAGTCKISGHTEALKIVSKGDCLVVQNSDPATTTDIPKNRPRSPSFN